MIASKAMALCRMGDFSRAYGLSDVSLEKKGNSPLVWLSRGEILLHQRKSNAEFCFQKALSAMNGSWEIVVELTRVYLFYDYVQKALVILSEAVSQTPSKAPLWFELGNCHKTMGNRAKALEAYSNAFELDPGFELARKAFDRLSRMGFFDTVRAKLFGLK
jgi:predicted Zn-dependent protease